MKPAKLLRLGRYELWTGGGTIYKIQKVDCGCWFLSLGPIGFGMWKKDCLEIYKRRGMK